MSSYSHNLSDEDRRILRIVVKNVHLKYHPKEFCTNWEADKMIAAIAPLTLEKLKEVGKKFKVDEL
jgi:hypothetical protein|tara:strand:- start:699 stop:896 length:198 start_codon:yes stop_codon:yes gene_type:complete